MKNGITTIIAVAAMVICLQSHADVPLLLPLQGTLADSSDQPVDDLVDMHFAIYNVETGGTEIWAEDYTAADQVDVDEGFFTVYLGSITAIDFSLLTQESELWLGMTVGTDAEMDRIRLATVPFAMEAANCNQIGSLTESDIVTTTSPSAGITSSQITDWDTAFGWGDHGAVGYLTSYTETDPIFAAAPAAGITATQITEWDTAFGWGDHAGLYAPLVHNHDDTYYTETEMQTSGSAQLHWDNLTNVPTGFADGVDNTIEVDGVDYAGGSQTLALNSSHAVVRSVSMTLPQSGYVMVTAMGVLEYANSGLDAAQCSLVTGTSLDYSNVVAISDGNSSYTSNNVGVITLTRGFSVGSGTQTFRMVCREYSGTVTVYNSNITAVFSSNRY